MEYAIKNFEHLIGIKGLSEQLLRNHFTLYQGYIHNFNTLDHLLQDMEKEGKFGMPAFTELNRRLGWEFNGMRLHEYYFENLSKESQTLDISSPLSAAITKEFGSYEMWEKDFKAMSTMRGIGWVILYHDTQAQRLFNVWINEHDVGHFSGATPLLVMDVFEHAYFTDYGINRKEYIENIMTSLNWKLITQRFA